MDDLIPKSAVPPGSIGLMRIGGLLGRAIMIGQAVVGDASRWTHVFIALDDGTALEAMPEGARIRPMDLDGDPPVLIGWKRDLTDAQRQRIVDVARQYEGCGYSFTSYFAIYMAHAGWVPRRFERYIAKSHRQICSALADHIYHEAGIELFDDGRPPHSVTPGDLAGRFEWGDFEMIRLGRRD